MAKAAVHADDASRYLAGAPHLKHVDLQRLYRQLAAEALALAVTDGRRPRVLDLGAGEGTATLALLELGADVVAVDDDGARLELLRERTSRYHTQIVIHEKDAVEAVHEAGRDYDVVSAISFLHHVPDYEELVESALDALRPGGVFFSFQDPLLHASLGSCTRWYARAAYLAWRVSRGDLRHGAARYLRRRRHGFSRGRPEDWEEFHAQRGGVDQQALVRALERRGVHARLIRYFSTQSPLLQRLGSAFGLENTFALIGGPIV